jgi:hypothetical protein
MTSKRLVLTDEAWADIAKILEEIKNKTRRPPEQSDRLNHGYNRLKLLGTPLIFTDCERRAR